MGMSSIAYQTIGKRRGKNHVVVFPKVKAAICGFPDSVTLTPAQARVLKKLPINGHRLESISLKPQEVRCYVILKSAGLIQSSAANGIGLTHLGQAVAEALSDAR